MERFEPSSLMFLHDKMYLPHCYTYSSILTRDVDHVRSVGTRNWFFKNDSVKRMPPELATSRLPVNARSIVVAGEKSRLC